MISLWASLSSERLHGIVSHGSIQSTELNVFVCLLSLPGNEPEQCTLVSFHFPAQSWAVCLSLPEAVLSWLSLCRAAMVSAGRQFLVLIKAQTTPAGYLLDWWIIGMMGGQGRLELFEIQFQTRVEFSWCDGYFRHTCHLGDVCYMYVTFRLQTLINSRIAL